MAPLAMAEVCKGFPGQLVTVANDNAVLHGLIGL